MWYFSLIYDKFDNSFSYSFGSQIEPNIRPKPNRHKLSNIRSRPIPIPIPITISNLGSISSTFYKQILRTQIPKPQKDWYDFFALLGSECVKAARRTWMKLTPDELRHCSKLNCVDVSVEVWGVVSGCSRELEEPEKKFKQTVLHKEIDL